MKYLLAAGWSPSSETIVAEAGAVHAQRNWALVKERLQSGRYVFSAICTVCCRDALDHGSRKERGATWQLPPCHIDKSQTQSYWIFYLIKRKAGTQPMGGRDGKGYSPPPRGTRLCSLWSKALLDTSQAPENKVKQWGLSHPGKVITLSAMLVYITPLQGSHQRFAKSSNSPSGARPCYLVNQQKMQFCSGGFASLGTRCCFSLCWGPRITSDKKKPQADKWAKIIWYFWAFQYIISFSYTSVSLYLWLRLCLAANVSLNTAIVQCWKTDGWLIWTQAGLVALVFDWLVHIEMMGH